MRLRAPLPEKGRRPFCFWGSIDRCQPDTRNPACAGGLRAGPGRRSSGHQRRPRAPQLRPPAQAQGAAARATSAGPGRHSSGHQRRPRAPQLRPPAQAQGATAQATSAGPGRRALSLKAGPSQRKRARKGGQPMPAAQDSFASARAKKRTITDVIGPLKFFNAVPCTKGVPGARFRRAANGRACATTHRTVTLCEPPG